MTDESRYVVDLGGDAGIKFTPAAGDGPASLAIGPFEFRLTPAAVFRLARAGCLAADHLPEGYNEAPYVVVARLPFSAESDASYSWDAAVADREVVVEAAAAATDELGRTDYFDRDVATVVNFPDTWVQMGNVSVRDHATEVVADLRAALLWHPDGVAWDHAYWRSLGFAVGRRDEADHAEDADLLVFLDGVDGDAPDDYAASLAALLDDDAGESRAWFAGFDAWSPMLRVWLAGGDEAAIRAARGPADEKGGERA